MNNNYEIQNVKTKEWHIVSANCPKHAIEKLTGKVAIRTHYDENNVEYSASIQYGQRDKYKLYNGHYAPISLWTTLEKPKPHKE